MPRTQLHAVDISIHARVHIPLAVIAQLLRKVVSTVHVVVEMEECSVGFSGSSWFLISLLRYDFIRYDASSLSLGSVSFEVVHRCIHHHSQGGNISIIPERSFLSLCSQSPTPTSLLLASTAFQNVIEMGSYSLLNSVSDFFLLVDAFEKHPCYCPSSVSLSAG